MNPLRILATHAAILSSLALALVACSGTGPASPQVDATTGDSTSIDVAGDVPVDSAPRDTLGQGGAPLDIGARLQQTVDESELPSLVVGVADGTRLRAIGASGLRSVDESAPVLVSDPYHLGSDTKAMTATLVARHVELGTLSWQSTLPELFPDLAVHPGFEGVTLTDLLSHIGGAPTSLPAVLGQDAWLAAFSDDAPLDQQRAAVVADILQSAPAVAPGTFAYSNAGYVIAGAALERLTGKPWEALMREEVFEPLGMHDCGFGPPQEERDDAPVGHVMNGATAQVAADAPYNDNPAFLGPAGTVYCNAESWLPFLQAHLRAEDGDYLSADSWEALHTPNGDGYALGWGVGERSWAEGRVYSHAGSNSMWFAIAWLAPSVDRIYFAMTNIATANTADLLNDVVGELIEGGSL